jgi:hypothetical protein
MELKQLSVGAHFQATVTPSERDTVSREIPLTDLPPDQPAPPFAPPLSGVSWSVEPPAQGSQSLAAGSTVIKIRRSWKPWQKMWQLAAIFIVGLVLGLLINYGGGGNGSGTQSSASQSSNLPPPASTGAGATTTTTTAGTHSTTTTSSTPGSSTTTTTAAAGSATTTTTSATAVTGTPSILIPATQMKGNWTSSSFTVAGGTWNIGWAFQCSPTPVSGPSLQIFVVAPGANPSGSPAVGETGASGQSVTPQTGAGAHEVVVESPSSCVWAVKVSGIAG